MPEPDRQRYAAAMRTAGATAQEAMLLLFVTRGAVLDGKAPPPAADLDLDEHWGAQADQNIGHVRRLRSRVAPSDWAEITLYIGDKRVVDMLAKIGRRLR